ncbi:MAG: L-threonylcarbamoyladenylate synthase [Oceanicoccus sp.]
MKSKSQYEKKANFDVPLKFKAAVQQLNHGSVIAYPTEAVWGFGCDPNNRQAVARLLRLKQRPVSKGLILVAASVEQFQPYICHLDPHLQQKFSRPTERPTTWLLSANDAVPTWINGDFTDVALRVSTHQQTAALCRAFGGPIVSTSANVAGGSPALWPWQLQGHLGRGLDYILSGQLGVASKPSEIRDLISDKVIRPA